jgi:hypothetical protein
MKNRNREEDLLKLADYYIENLERSDCEYGGWGLDDKRPFGSSGAPWIAQDIARIIGIDLNYIEEESEEQEQMFDYCHSLYDELGDFLRKKWKELRSKA